MSFWRFHIWFILGLCLGACAMAQTPVGPVQVQPVQWTGSIAANAAIEPGHRATIEVAADIQDGWHVYGVNQLPSGPTPLRVALDANEFVEAAGAIRATEPVKKHDSSFDLETEMYTHSFTLRLPVELKLHSAAGKHTVSVSVRFQACSDRICLLPKTVHVSVPVEISPGS